MTAARNASDRAGHPAASTRARPLLRSLAEASLVVLLAAAYSFYSLLRHASFGSAGYDLGIFDQAVRSYSLGHPPWAPVKGIEYNLLGDHFHPIIALIQPLYLIWPDPRLLLIVQALVVALALVPILRILDRRLPRVCSGIVAVIIMLSWPMQGLIDFDFHEVCFAVPLIAMALDAIDTRSRSYFLISSALLVLVREDMGFVVTMLGVSWALRSGGVGSGSAAGGRTSSRGDRILGLCVAVAGLAASVAIVRLVIPAFSTAGSYAYWDYGNLGTSMGEVLRNAVTHPLRTLGIAVNCRAKRSTLIALCAPFLLLFLGSSWSLAALPLVAERFLATRATLWMARFHYNGPVAVILLLASADALGRLRNPLRTRVAWVLGLSLLSCTVALAAIRPFDVPFVTLPGKVSSLKSAEVEDEKTAISLIPPDTCVSADDRIVPHLTRTNRVTVLGTPAPRTDYVIINLGRHDSGNGIADPRAELARFARMSYQQVLASHDIRVLRAPLVTPSSEVCGPGSP